MEILIFFRTNLKFCILFVIIFHKHMSKLVFTSSKNLHLFGKNHISSLKRWKCNFLKTIFLFFFFHFDCMCVSIVDHTSFSLFRFFVFVCICILMEILKDALFEQTIIFQLLANLSHSKSKSWTMHFETKWEQRKQRKQRGDNNNI